MAVAKSGTGTWRVGRGCGTPERGTRGLETRARGDAGTLGRGHAGTRGRETRGCGNAGMRGCGDAEILLNYIVMRESL